LVDLIKIVVKKYYKELHNFIWKGAFVKWLHYNASTKYYY